MKQLILLSLIGTSLTCFGQKNYCQLLKQGKNYSNSTLTSSLRSDTIDILNYTINLNITDFTNQTISGSCTVNFTPKQNNISSISLDLLLLNIDSILKNGNPLTYSYNDTLLVVSLPNPLSSTDTTSITVFYNGNPKGDPSGWGGFYFQSGYAFNLGVGFESIPHNYGRVWFPCFDNFVERSTYTFNITTAAGKVGVCNGELISENVVSGDTIARTWQLDEEIPSYLACVAVANYETVHQIHNGISGTIPIELYGLAGDTTGIKSSFINLGSCIESFENAYGPYRWNKVGYSMVPFSSGAMEHATNIAYPKSAATGSLANETLMAHELSHHWWGDLATCQTAEEMWINEGMARYSEALFLEHVYGRDTYEDDIASNHSYVIRYPQHLEGGYLSLDSIPLEYTYGDHVYLKGADIAHTLRGYLGDSLFFSGLTTFLENNQFTDVSNEDFQLGLSQYTGVDLTDFFNGWVMNRGFPLFETRWFSVIQNGSNYDVTVAIMQKLKNAPEYFNNVPLNITFMDGNWNTYTTKLTMSGHVQQFTFSVPFNPIYVTLDINNLISDAITENQIVIANTGTFNLPDALMTVTVESLVDSVFLRVEHMWVGADQFTTPDLKYQLSGSRYWRVDGIINSSFDARAQLVYDGRVTTGSGGWLDNDLVSITEDSLRLFYRPNPQTDWVEFPYYSKDVLFNSVNAYGLIKIDSLLKGEYTFGNDKFDAIYGGISVDEINAKVKLYPNPNNGNFRLEFNKPTLEESSLTIFDISGKIVLSKTIPPTTSVLEIKVDLKDGNYLYQLQGKDCRANGKLIITQ